MRAELKAPAVRVRTAVTGGPSSPQPGLCDLAPLLCLPVAATKPIIRAGELGLTLPAGASTSLTCEASGSPPISYRWFRRTPAGKAEPLGSGAELAWPSLRPSDSGTYFCEAENKAGAGAVQSSDAVQLTVTGECPQPQLGGEIPLQCKGTASCFPARKEGNDKRLQHSGTSLPAASSLCPSLFPEFSFLLFEELLFPDAKEDFYFKHLFIICGFFEVLPGSVMLLTAVQQA